MDELWDVIKFVGSLILTAVITIIINIVFSFLRKRQLYLSCDDILKCHDQNVDGHTATLIVYNKGKDKEQDVRIIFPPSIHVQLLSTDQPGIKLEGNIISIERVLPKDEIKLSVFIGGKSPVSGSDYPVLKSADADGAIFFQRSSVPPSIGPFIAGVSCFLGIFGFGFYLTYSNPSFDYYYRIRYSYMYASGLAVSVGGDARLVAEGSRGSPTIKVLEESRSGDKIIFHFDVKNPFPTEIYASVYSTGYSDYKEEEMRFRGRKIEPDDQARLSLLKERLWVSDADVVGYPDNVAILPFQTKKLDLSKTVAAGSDLSELKIMLVVDGLDKDGKEFKDYYYYYPARGAYRDRIQGVLDSIKSKLSGSP